MASDPRETCDVNDLDLGAVVAHLLDSGGPQPGRSPEQANIDVGQYRCFLVLACLCPREPLVPSPRIDRVWHAHMLDTRAYLADCRRALGGILCHRAVAGPDEGDGGTDPWASFEHTRDLAAERLGVDLGAEIHSPSVVPAGHGWRATGWDHPSAVLIPDGLPAQDPLKTVAEVAELTRLSKPTIYRLIDAGTLEAIRIGGTIRIPESALHARLRQGWREPEQ